MKHTAEEQFIMWVVADICLCGRQAICRASCVDRPALHVQ